MTSKMKPITNEQAIKAVQKISDYCDQKGYPCPDSCVFYKEPIPGEYSDCVLDAPNGMGWKEIIEYAQGKETKLKNMKEE